jgi:hypothetical protein
MTGCDNANAVPRRVQRVGSFQHPWARGQMTGRDHGDARTGF